MWLWGSFAGFNNTGSDNVVIGYQTGQNNTGGNNTAIGKGALHASSSGSNNVAIGTDAGSASTQSGGVFLGYQAGKNETGGNKLYIANSNTSLPLIYGDFAADSLQFNANNMVLSSNTSGNATLYIDADTDNSNENDNPGIIMTQDGGSNAGYILLEGDDQATVNGSEENSLLIGTVDQDIQFFTSAEVRMTIDNNSNRVGIGTSSPSDELHVMDSTSDAAARIESARPGGVASVYLENLYREWRLVNDTDGKLRVMDEGNSETFMVFDTLGRIGIDEFSPDAKLEVTGRIITDTLEVDGKYTLPWVDGNNNEVLTTNGSGVVTWQLPSSSPWTLDNDTVSVTGKRVGIGTEAPVYKLDVKGSSSGNDVSMRLNSVGTSHAPSFYFDEGQQR